MCLPRLASKTDTVSSPGPYLLSSIAPSVSPLCKGKQIKKSPAPAFKNWAFRTNDNTAHAHSNSQHSPLCLHSRCRPTCSPSVREHNLVLEKETEAQGGRGMCPRSQLVREGLGFELRQSSRAYTLLFSILIFSVQHTLCYCLLC